MLKAFFRTFLLFVCIAVFAQEGTIKGTVLDADTGEPLIGANIILKGASNGASTNLDGEYIMYRVPDGEYSIVISYVGYRKLEISNIHVEGSEPVKLDIVLNPDVETTEAVVTTARRVNTNSAALLSNQKAAQSITSGISSEQISKAPDSKASDALKRVTGLTVVEDKFVFVRGLSERYNNAQLNKASIPSPEPDKRVVPFDIFPSNILDNAIVRKSFLPSLPGDFAGGCIQLSTKEFPEKFNGNLSMSSSMNTASTFKTFNTYNGGSLDFLGFDDGSRQLPSIVRDASEQGKIREAGMFSEGFSAEEIEELGEAFSNNWSTKTMNAPVNQSYSVSLGNNLSLMNKPFGYVASLTYKNSYSQREEDRSYFIMGADGLEARHHYEGYKKSSFNAVWGAVLNGSYRLSPKDKMSLKFTYTHNADDEVVTYGLYPNRDHDLDEKYTSLRWVERALYSFDLSGEHATRFINKSQVNWQVNYSLASRSEPDTRELLYEAEHGSDFYVLADESCSGSRFFSDVSDHNIDSGLDIKTPFKQWHGLNAKFEYGTRFQYKYREIDSRRFRFIPQDFNEVDISQDPEDIFTEENIDNDGFMLEEGTRATDNYKATQLISAGYAMVDMPLNPKTRFVGGLRVENSNQKVETYELFNPDADPVIGEVNEIDLMPAFTVTYRLNDEMNVRSGFSRTVSRPSFRELSNLEFTDIGGHAIVGNPDLERAVIYNGDLRWEWYPGIAENISFAILYKYFSQPIEQTLINATELTSSWQNAKNAYNVGMEFEFTKNLGFIHETLKPFSFTGNLSLIHSQVQLQESGMESSKERPLQGQSPYVVNAMLGYKNVRFGTETTLSYNVSGRRIMEVGMASSPDREGTPDIYEEPTPKLDMTVVQPISQKLNMKLSASNILNSDVEYTQGDEIQRSYKVGRSFSFGLSYTF